MLATLFVQIMMIVLTIAGTFEAEYKALFIAVASISIILMTATSLINDPTDDEINKKTLITALKLIMMGIFSILSGGYLGFVSFMFVTEIKAKYRGSFAIALFLLAELLFRKRLETNMLVVWALILIVALSIVYGIQVLMNYVYKTKLQEQNRLRTANINALHTKQMNEQLVMNNYLVDKNARLMERENISRNIHNSVGHSITAAIMTLDAADMLYDVKPDEARKKMQDANDRIRGSLDSIRRAVRVLDENSKMIAASDLKSELLTIADSFMLDTTRNVHMDVSQIDDNVSMPHEHVEFLTGAFEEILSNGVRHGEADSFILFLSGDGAHVRMQVSDNGHGDYNEGNEKQKISQGFGLKKMISYAGRCGGSAQFHNNDGFVSIIELPIYENVEGNVIQ